MENKNNKALDLVLLCLVFLAVLYISLSKVDSAKVSERMQDQGNALSHLVRMKTIKINELTSMLQAKDAELSALKKEVEEVKMSLEEANKKLGAISTVPEPVAAAK